MPLLAMSVFYSIATERKKLETWAAEESLESAKQHLAPNSWANRTMRVGIILGQQRASIHVDVMSISTDFMACRGLRGVVLVALAVPRFTVIFGFFAALTVPCVSVVLPLLFAGRLVEMSRWRRLYHAFLMLLAVLGMVFGIYTSVSDVLSG